MDVAVVVDVERMPRGDGIQGNLGRPLPRARVGDEIVFIGWAFGTELPVRAVELVRGGELLARVEPDEERPDVAASFPDASGAGSSGFRIALPTAAALGGEILVRAVLEDGGEAPLATVRARRAAVLDANALPPPLVGDVDISMAEAMERYRSSPVTRWANLTHEVPPLGSAWQRISDHELFEPLIRPGFAVDPDDRVFTIGSCFARNVEGALYLLGMDVVSRTDAFEQHAMREGGEPRSFTNKYNTEAILNELRWALGDGGGFPPEAVVRMPDGTFQDPHGGPDLEFTDEATTLERHRLLTELTRQIAGCRLVVITLGLNETFFDTATGLYTNVKPWAEPERFRFRVLPFEQVMRGLEDIHRLLTEHGHPDLQIVVTVSPVPMWATFTGQDVVVANTLTKSLLRTAAGTWTGRHANVHYFPGYEIVLNSARSVVWERDGRHVRPPFVRQIMDLFVRTHVSGRAPA
ncbi:MAG: hypothetical protein QOD86_2238 [Miltoncostaeaceae bacterium]|jgi:hypothetical protein|nr:hypothetical protein [Miltoncostaeaceae bacterium]